MEYFGKPHFFLTKKTVFVDATDTSQRGKYSVKKKKTFLNLNIPGTSD